MFRNQNCRRVIDVRTCRWASEWVLIFFLAVFLCFLSSWGLIAKKKKHCIVHNIVEMDIMRCAWFIAILITCSTQHMLSVHTSHYTCLAYGESVFEFLLLHQTSIPYFGMCSIRQTPHRYFSHTCHVREC